MPPQVPPPAGGYALPAKPALVPATAGFSDPIVLAPGSSFSAWFTKVQEIAKRSWKSALIISAIGIAAPYALAALAGNAGGWGAGFSLFGVGSFFSAISGLLLGWVVAFLVAVSGCYVAAAGWAAGSWALVHEASSVRSANLGQAFGYGLRRAMALFPWTVLAAVAFSIGSACLWLPGVYLAFGFSLFGFVAIFERGQSPVGRSFSLTHNSAMIGPTLGKVGIVFGVFIVYQLIIGVVETAIEVAIAFGTSGTFGYRFGYGIVEAAGAMLMTPAFAVLLIGLLPTYAELRAREAPLSTAQLQQELGS